jgi:DNA repair protein RecO (recombination protein O)
MEWQDQGIVLGTRKHGENSLIIQLFTPTRGRVAGFLPRGASSRKNAPHIQLGTTLNVRWRGRLAEQLGTLTLESTHTLPPTTWLCNARMQALQTLTELLHNTLPEAEPHASLWQQTYHFLNTQFIGTCWLSDYIIWEINLLQALGFGLQLHQCAISGQTTDLGFVSPKTGRAASRQAAAPWQNSLLPLPHFLINPNALANPQDLQQGLQLTGFFLLTHVYGHGLGKEALPQARQRLLNGLQTHTAANQMLVAQTA